MKRPLTPVITIGIALLLIGSIAYAADRRKQTKLVNKTSPEEESLRAELLAAVDDHEKKLPGTGDIGKAASRKSSGKSGQVKLRK
jgi:hypothetical protein